MGIPHLISYLQPYAVGKSLNTQQIVLDGPAFAYHVFYLSLGGRQAARNPFEGAPTYLELGELAIAWLDAMIESGATITKIYFDGFLPATKFDTRSQRMASYTNQVIVYNQIHTEIPFRNLPRKEPQLFSGPTVRTNFAKLPAVPFLVPAVLEALLNCERYRDITEVVPGEADLYCARYLEQHGGTVITGDSDLLIHNLGSDGAVSFFKEIEVKSDGKNELLYFQVYHPAAIAERLSLPSSHGLQSLAFEIVMDPHASFRKVVQNALILKSVKEHKNMYKDFIQEYTPSGISVVDPHVGVRSILKELDPRISEFVLQFRFYSEIAGRPLSSIEENAKDIHVFLPFLLDCPVRTNAWEISTATRQLAYGLINASLPRQQTFTVFEHRRQQKESTGRELSVPECSELDEACLTVIRLIERLESKIPKLSGFDKWLAMAVYQDLDLAASYGKVALSRGLVQMYKKQSFAHDGTLSWDSLHFLAQIQGSYYSFRMVKQLLRLVLSCSNSASMPESFRKLLRKFEELSPMSEVQDQRQYPTILQTISENNLITILEALLGIIKAPISKESKKEREKRKRDQGEPGLLAPRRKSTNPFAILEDE
ncbi:hypothetical protein BP6252_05261 [Coleophoma cylindrospora]|uniref:Asteroid domain-containing protein n=1 Tax=Coleophoma cylindrospora TaxID=1849047 RepID=A0A3D8RTB9_9HELO|nr:hypothetical protein BP6252_05261 [Coleophoma cylindrospora]